MFSILLRIHLGMELLLYKINSTCHFFYCVIFLSTVDFWNSLDILHRSSLSNKLQIYFLTSGFILSSDTYRLWALNESSSFFFFPVTWVILYVWQVAWGKKPFIKSVVLQAIMEWVPGCWVKRFQVSWSRSVVSGKEMTMVFTFVTWDASSCGGFLFKTIFFFFLVLYLYLTISAATSHPQ